MENDQRVKKTESTILIQSTNKHRRAKKMVKGKRTEEKIDRHNNINNKINNRNSKTTTLDKSVNINIIIIVRISSTNNKNYNQQ